MPLKRNDWIEMPRDEAAMMLLTGEQLWRTARDLQEQAKRMPDFRTPIIHTTRCWGYGFSAVILQPLAAEYLLKGLSLRKTGRYKKTHNLDQLYKALDPGTRAEIAEQGKQRGIAVPEFLNEHRNDFEDLRYPVEGISSTPSMDAFDKTLAALVAAC